MRLVSLAILTSALLSPAAAAAPVFPDLPTIYARYSADSPANAVMAPLTQNFGAAQVDVANAKLSLENLGFAAIPYPNGIGPAAPVYFSSTGTLPSPLKMDTPYYVVPASNGGYRVYAVATDADAEIQPGGIAGELVFPAQNVSQGVGHVLFKDAGTGTHTLRTNPLLTQFTDLTANGFNSSSVNPKDKHAALELLKDMAGRPYVRTAGATARENYLGSYNAYGQTFVQTPSDKRFAARQKVGQQRVVYQVFVGRVRSYQERQVAKFLLDPAKVLTESNEVIYGFEPRLASKVNTGDLVTVKSYPGGSLPAPLVAGKDYFARRVDAKKMTLHLSAEDAAAGTQPIDLTSAGAGPLLFALPERVGDRRRWSFFAEVLEPGPTGGNTLSARLQEPLPQGGGILKIASAFTTSGTNNGAITGLSAMADLMPISFWVPPRAALPAPLKAGQKYWVSKAGSATRLFESEAAAKAAVGKPTSTSGCIQFTAPGRGEALASYDDGASAIAYGTIGAFPVFNKRVPLGPMCVFVFKIDFDDPAQPSVLATLGVNEVVSEQILVKKEKGLTPPAANDKSAAWTLFNSAQGHVPIDFDCYDIILGSSTTAVADKDLQAIIEYFKTKYGIN